jgi:tetratricopeptide (TPR) repeat protein
MNNNIVSMLDVMKDPEDVVKYYRDLLQNNIKVKDIKLRISNYNVILNNVKDIPVDNYDTYKLIFDAYMLLALDYQAIGYINYAEVLFEDVINFGKKNDKYSKKDYYDLLNCAYSWMVYILYNRKDYKKAIEYCNIVINNYDSVKNNKGYHVSEIDSVKICKDYLNSINKIQ